ncbi:unnamed protein product [Owenia fusiformis]|uniref:C-type lectin domain-containing protein n=1 Tax=Owenia fusiformis TaxID=6347 RepID=A0A8S4NKN2_OWEFU|nr:unnamed protein product [Owenia fusiformis]
MMSFSLCWGYSETMLLVIYAFVCGLMISGECSDTNIGSMQWRGQSIQYFNRETALFVQSEECLPGFFRGFWQNDNCYMFVTSQLTRSEASAFCTEAALGNGLVAIPTELHHAYIVSQIVMQPELRTADYQKFWTSGENVIDGVWTWSTTVQPFNYTNFGKGRDTVKLVM